MAKKTGVEAYIDDTIKITGGKMPLDLLAHDEAEAEAFRAALKGKHGGKSITVRVADPGEFTPNLHWRE